MVFAYVFGASFISTGTTQAAAGVNQQINFQARLLNAQGATVPDGNYNIEFKIYQDGDGASAGDTTGSPAGTLKWTEDRLNNGSGVTVKNGYMSVYLGSITSLASVDFNQDTLWLSLNIGNTSACTITTNFTANCGGDGEMLPMKRFASSPYALNSSKLGGLSSTQFVQLAQGVQADNSATQPSIFINKTAAASILQLQKSSADVLLVDTNGTTTLQAAAGNNATLTVKQASTAASGDIFSIVGANGTTKFISVTSTAANAGSISIQSVGGSNALTLDSGSGTIILGTTTTTIQKSSTALAIDLNNASNSVLTVTNSGAGIASLNIESGGQFQVGGTQISSSNLSNDASLAKRDAANTFTTGVNTFSRNGTGTGDASLAVTGTTVADATSSLVRIGGAISSGSTSGTYLGINAASAFAGNLQDLQTNGSSVYRVNSFGDLTSGFTSLDGSTTTNGTAVVASTSMTVTSGTNFNAGNYIKLDNGAAACSGAVVICYAKITNVAGNTLTISPALVWATARPVTEWHIPEVGGIDLSQSLTNRYGTGYFINGITTGNGSTTYTDGSISATGTTFDLLNTSVTTLNVGGAATTINIGASGATTTLTGSLSVTGTISGGAPTTGTSGYLSRSGTTLQPATAGDNFTTTGNISTTGSGTVSSAGAISGPTSGNTINGLIISSGALSGISTIGLSGAISGGTTYSGSGVINTTGGAIQTNSTDRITNAGGLTNITGFTQSSGTHTIASAATSGDTFSIANSSLNTSGANLANLSVKNNNTGAAGLSVNGLTLTPTNSTPTSGTNTLNALNLAGVTAAANQAFVGLNVGSNYNSALVVAGTPIINGTGVVQSAGISGSYTGITGVGTLTTGTLGSGFTAVNVAQGGTGAATLSSNGILQGNGTSAVTAISPGGAGTVLLSNGTTASFTTISNTSLAAGSYSNITGVGTLGSLTVTGTISANTVGTINSLSINAGAISGATSIGLSGAISGGTTYSGSGNINTTGGTLQTNSTDRITNTGGLTNITGFTQTSGTHAITSAATSGDVFTLTDTSLNTAGANLANLSVKNNNTAGAGIAVSGLTLTVTSATPASGTNSTSAINLGNVTAAANQAFYGLNVGTGYNDILRYNGTQIVSGTGLVQNAAFDATLAYSNINKIGTITTGTWNASVIGSQYGGTGLNTSGSTGVPSIAAGTWSINASLAATLGGTGQTTTTVGDLLVGGSSNTWNKLSAGAANTVLLGNGAGVSPSYGQIGNAYLTAGSYTNITGVGTLGSLTVTGTISANTSGTINGLSVNAGALSGVSSISLNNSISGGTTYSGSGDITSTSGSVIAAAHTGTGAVTVSSGGAGALTLTSSSGTIILGGSTNTFQRTSATFALDIVNAGASSTLSVTNSNGSQVANLDIEGGLNIGSTQTYKIGSTDINTAGTLSNVAYKNAANVFTSGQSIQSTGSSALLVQTNAGASTLLTADTTAMIVKIGTASTGDLSGVDLVVAEVQATGSLRIGSGTDYIEFNSTGPVFSGTRRPSKYIVLSPEYSGASLTADGSANTSGTMTSDSDGSANAWRTFYKWTSAQAGNQDMTIIVRVTLPADFDTWETGSCPGATCALEVAYQTGLAATTNNGVTVAINNAVDTPGSTVCAPSEVASTTWTSLGCTEATLNDNAAPEWDAAGEIAVLRIKLKANSTASASAKVGDITLRYKAKF